MQKAIIVAGLGFGDEGKGTIVDALTNTTGSTLVVRYNGGPQAQHNVVLPDGRHHTFSQFGAGTLAGARTHLSKRMIIDPFALLVEAEHLMSLGAAPIGPWVHSDLRRRLTIDRDAPVVTRYHMLANHVREAGRGSAAHGSCGRGIGECRRNSLEDPDYLRAGDLADLPVIEAKLARGLDTLESEFGPVRVHPKRIAEALYMVGRSLPVVDGSWLAEQMRVGTTIFEGAQGVLLDQDWGFQPHTTWSDCTFAWALDMLDDMGFSGEIERIGVTRAYQTRHGAGPLPTETKVDELDEPHNTGGFAGAFRQGHLDLELLRYAVSVVGGIDNLAVTHLDRRPHWNLCTRWGLPDIPGLIESDRIVLDRTTTFERQTALAQALFGVEHRGHELAHLSGDDLVRRLKVELGAPEVIRSYGPTRDDKRFGQ